MLQVTFERVGACSRDLRIVLEARTFIPIRVNASAEAKDRS
jgi:hypothetical protein